MPYHTRFTLTEARITSLFLHTLNVDVPSTSTDLFESAMLDSMAFIQLLVALEAEFGVSVSLDDMELEEFRSIERIAALIDRKASASAGAQTDPKASVA